MWGYGNGVFVQSLAWVWSTGVGMAAVWPRGWSVMATQTALTNQMRLRVLTKSQVSPGTLRSVYMHPKAS